MRQKLSNQEKNRRADMTDMNGVMPAESARRAAWLLAGCDIALPPAGTIPTGESERLELVDVIAEHMKVQACGQSLDLHELAVCRRLLEHLRGPLPDQMPTLRLQ